MSFGITAPTSAHNIPAKKAAPGRVYLLMPWGRVGSNLILDIMAQHPSMTCHNEPLTGIATRGGDVSENQKRWYERILTRDEPGVDFINLSAASIVDLDWFTERLVQEPHTKYIFLSRRNIVLVVFSVLKARHYAEEHKRLHGKASWAVKRGKEIDLRTPIVVDEFSKLLELARNSQEKLDLLHDSLGGLQLYYEDIEIDLNMVIREICSHIGVGLFRYETRIAKAIRRPYSEEFSGLSELKQTMEKSDPRAYKLLEQVT